MTQIDPESLPVEAWDAYDAAAEAEATTGERPPLDITTAALIDADPEAYVSRVNAMKYAHAMRDVDTGDDSAWRSQTLAQDNIPANVWDEINRD